MSMETFSGSMQGPPKTLRGGKRIEENQDAFVTRDLGDGRLLLAVMDGISNSPQGGSVARRLALQLTECRPSDVEFSPPGLVSLIQKMSEEEFSWGSTLTLAVVDKESGRGVVAWMGDSPAFIVRNNSSEATESLAVPHVAPDRSLTSCFSHDPEQRIDTADFQLNQGDVLVLGTDSAHGLNDLSGVGVPLGM